MFLRRRSILLLVLLLGIVLSAPSSSSQSEPASAPATGSKRFITERDLFNFTWIANPQLSPDGSRTAFTRVVVDEKRTGYETSIWTVATAGGESPVRMTNGKHDASPRWSPDGRHIAFLRGGDKDETGKPRPPQIAILSLAGGEARLITNLLKGAANPVWSPDGKRIAFLSTTTQEDIAKAERKKNRPSSTDDRTSKSRESARTESTAEQRSPEPESEHEPDVHVIVRAVYRSNREGYLDPKRHDHLWVVDVPTTSDELPKPLQLTTGEFDEGEPFWTPDGSRLYFITTRIDEPYYELPTTDIYSVPSGGGNLEKLTTIPMDIGDLALSPDGRRIAFHGSVAQPVRSYSQPDVFGLGSGGECAAAQSHRRLRLRHGTWCLWR